MERHRRLLREQTPAEYFKELVESALARQHLQAGDLTEYYLVNLLCQYVRLDRRRRTRPGEPLAVRLARALADAAARSSAPGCAASAISRCSRPASSPTASAAATSTSTTTCPWASTPTDR